MCTRGGGGSSGGGTYAMAAANGGEGEGGAIPVSPTSLLRQTEVSLTRQSVSVPYPINLGFTGPSTPSPGLLQLALRLPETPTHPPPCDILA